MNVLALDRKSDSGDARKALDRAASAAARRILRESGRTVTQLAGAMCYTSRSLDEFLSGRIHWGAQSIAALAAATDQHPVEMLAREIAGFVDGSSGPTSDCVCYRCGSPATCWSEPLAIGGEYGPARLPSCDNDREG